jgi:hypothetical protein
MSFKDLRAARAEALKRKKERRKKEKFALNQPFFIPCLQQPGGGGCER